MLTVTLKFSRLPLVYINIIKVKKGFLWHIYHCRIIRITLNDVATLSSCYPMQKQFARKQSDFILDHFLTDLDLPFYSLAATALDSLPL